MAITSVVMVAELVGGFMTGSIALISDAGHMFTHAFALGISLAAIIIAKKPLCHHRTFGLFRAEILAAFVNGLFLLAVVGVVCYEAVQRIRHPVPVLGLPMLLIAAAGLAVNLISVAILHGSHKKDLNIRSVFYHMIADAASSIGILAAAVVILITNWVILDPVVSLLISLAILWWAWGVLRESSVILLEMAPGGLNAELISEDLKARFPEILRVTNDHLWAITQDMLIYTAHVVVGNPASADKQAARLMNEYLRSKYRIIESTLQIGGPGPEMEECDKEKRRRKL